MKIRFAEAQDAEALLRIYAQSIDTPVTFEYTLPDAAEFRRRIGEILAFYPYLVCERDGAVVAYAYAHRFQTRIAYQWGAELSVYADCGAKGQGCGTALYKALASLLTLQGICHIYACVVIPNPDSERLHERLGFTRAGDFCSAGYKCGAWQSVRWYEKQLCPLPADPKPPIPVGALPPDAVRAILCCD
ncbi:MAG: N-acetyltransferase family protein [Oscillospiraceae bacterium]|nr:N-acetyltransferase family protein [Oscillospiraceae bacterium]